jgi:hypothetical protein
MCWMATLNARLTAHTSRRTGVIERKIIADETWTLEILGPGIVAVHTVTGIFAGFNPTQQTVSIVWTKRSENQIGRPNTILGPNVQNPDFSLGASLPRSLFPAGPSLLIQNPPSPTPIQLLYEVAIRLL